MLSRADDVLRGAAYLVMAKGLVLCASAAALTILNRRAEGLSLQDIVFGADLPLVEPAAAVVDSGDAQAALLHARVVRCEGGTTGRVVGARLLVKPIPGGEGRTVVYVTPVEGHELEGETFFCP